MTDGIKVEVDWNGDGDYSDTGEDVSRYVKTEAGISLEYGRDQLTALTPVVAGRGDFVLNNRDQRFSPRNTSSPLYGNLKPARQVKITRTVSGVTHTLFVGHTDDSPINPDLDSQTVALSLLDHLADFHAQTISTPLYRDLRSGTAIGHVLDACGWPADLRDLDVGATVIPWWWEGDTNALEALEKIVRSEGPPALLTVGASGEIIFRDRHHRLTRAASLTSQGTWYASEGTEPVMSKPFLHDEAWRNLINYGSMSVDVRKPIGLDAVFSSGEETITLLAGEQKIISVSTTDPFYDAVVPVSGTDYTLASGSLDDVRLIRTSGISTGVVLTAGGSGAVITGLQLRAIAVPVAHSLQIEASDVESIEQYGRRSFPSDLPWCSPGDAQAVLDLNIALRAQPLPIITVRFVLSKKNTARAGHILPRDLSDRVRVIEPGTWTNGEFFIESIRHELSDVYDHAVTIGLEAVPTFVDDVFRFDTTGRGFDQGEFGNGLDLTATLFRFDTSNQGFDQGAFGS